MSKLSLYDLTCRLAATHGEIRSALCQVVSSMSLADRTRLMAKGDPRLTKASNALLKVAIGNTSVIQQPPIIIQQAPIVVQQEAPAPAPTAIAPGGYGGAPMPPGVGNAAVPAVNTGPAPFGALLVTERAQRGFADDLLPEMNRMVSSGQSRLQVAAHIEGLVREAFTSKNQLYNVLIRHQATFEGDEEYRKNLERLIQVWVADTANSGA